MAGNSRRRQQHHQTVDMWSDSTKTESKLFRMAAIKSYMKIREQMEGVILMLLNRSGLNII